MKQINFFNLAYLAQGSEVQQKGLEVIAHSGIMEILHEYDPVLAGTLPLDIFVEGSDLDILCCSTEFETVKDVLAKAFGSYPDYSSGQVIIDSTETLIVNFLFHGFRFEVFVQPIDTRNQAAYRHMAIEYEILKKRGHSFKNKIIELKVKGIKTEPAFASLLQLSGDPYDALLHYSP